MVEGTKNTAQQYIDNSYTSFGLEDEDKAIAISALLFNMLFHDLCKVVLFDPFLGQIYNNLIVYGFQVFILTPLAVIILLKIIKRNKTKGFIYNSFFLIGTLTKKEYDPFEYYPILEKMEGLG